MVHASRLGKVDDGLVAIVDSHLKESDRDRPSSPGLLSRVRRNFRNSNVRNSPTRSPKEGKHQKQKPQKQTPQKQTPQKQKQQWQQQQQQQQHTPPKQTQKVERTRGRSRSRSRSGVTKTSLSPPRSRSLSRSSTRSYNRLGRDRFRGLKKSDSFEKLLERESRSRSRSRSVSSRDGVRNRRAENNRSVLPAEIRVSGGGPNVEDHTERDGGGANVANDRGFVEQLLAGDVDPCDFLSFCGSGAEWDNAAAASPKKTVWEGPGALGPNHPDLVMATPGRDRLQKPPPPTNASPQSVAQLRPAQGRSRILRALDDAAESGWPDDEER